MCARWSTATEACTPPPSSLYLLFPPASLSLFVGLLPASLQYVVASCFFFFAFFFFNLSFPLLGIVSVSVGFLCSLAAEWWAGGWPVAVVPCLSLSDDAVCEPVRS